MTIFDLRRVLILTCLFVNVIDLFDRGWKKKCDLGYFSESHIVTHHTPLSFIKFPGGGRKRYNLARIGLFDMSLLPWD